MCDAASLFLHARGRKLAKTKKTNTKRMENTPAGSMHAEQGSKTMVHVSSAKISHTLLVTAHGEGRSTVHIAR
ncbi:hypothetical protein EB796_010768 [Bugula neritina]|nr:hypothetical protein EB796_010768 [Bugula neritina]